MATMATTTATATATQQLINPYIYYFQRDSEGIDAQIERKEDR